MKRALLLLYLPLLCAASALTATPHPVPGSRLLLPYFEASGGFGSRSTLFAVVNGSGSPIDVRADVYSNRAVKVLTVNLQIPTNGVQTVNLRDWLGFGRLPNSQTLCPGGATDCLELRHLQAALTGQRSPKDGLYYSLPAGSDMVGFLVLTTAATNGVGGDFFYVDPARSFAEGHRLVRYNSASEINDPNDLCQDHVIRFLQGGGFSAGTTLTIWQWDGVEGSPSATQEAAVSRSRVGGSMFSETGQSLSGFAVDLPAVSRVDVESFNPSASFGTFLLSTRHPSVVFASYSAEQFYSVLMGRWCAEDCDPCNSGSRCYEPGNPACNPGTCLPPRLGASTLQGVVGQPFNSTLTVSGSSPTLTTSTLPPGIALTGTVLSGTPSAAGSFTVTARNNCGTETLGFQIAAAPCQLPTFSASLVAGVVGLPFVSNLTVSAGAQIVVDGTLPQGITLQGNVLSGTPLASGTFRLIARNSCGDRVIEIRIDPACVLPTIQATSVSGQAGVSFLSTLTVSAGAQIVLEEPLLAGLTLNGNVISGVPLASGTIRVRARNSCGDSPVVVINISPPCQLPTISATNLLGLVGVVFNSTVTVSQGATLSVQGSLLGLTLTGNVLAGVPTQSGTIRLVATNSCGSATLDVQIRNVL